MPVESSHNRHQPDVSFEIKFNDNDSQHTDVQKRETLTAHPRFNHQSNSMLNKGNVQKVRDIYQVLPGTTSVRAPYFNKNNADTFKLRQQLDNKSLNIKLENTNKKSGNETLRIFTGTAEKIIKWHKIKKDYFCYFEIIGAIVALEEGSVSNQKIMLLRDKKGPILQVIHYAHDYINIENFFVGQMLRCVGRMVGPNIMHGLSIREAKDDEVMALQRMCYISDHAISKSLKNPNLQ
ncbi:hypothetical protein FQR65_LT03880 [Abscondita terminalis]|nr:hypothetical protein FQR65_LT03880 [Abscondita terminalis]